MHPWRAQGGQHQVRGISGLQRQPVISVVRSARCVVVERTRLGPGFLPYQARAPGPPAGPQGLSLERMADD